MAIEALPPVCILAGGFGTRLGERVANTPKPLLEVAGEPFLVHQLRLLAGHGAREVVLCVGYLGEQIEEVIGDERFGIAISYSYDGPTPAGTLGAIRQALPRLSDRFLTLYGDTYLRLDYRQACAAWTASGLPALMTVLRNDGRWGRSNAVYERGRVISYDKAEPAPSMHWIDYGLGGFSSEVVAACDDPDLSVLQAQLASTGRLWGFEVFDRFFEIGTPQALEETERFFAECSRQS